MQNLASAIIRETDVFELNLLLQTLKLGCIGAIGNLTLSIDNLKDTFTSSHSLVDIGKLVDKCAYRASNLREGGDKGDKACCTHRALCNQRTAKDKHYSHGCNTQKLTHRRGELLTTSHPEHKARKLGIYLVELNSDILRSGIGLDNLNARERLVKHANHISQLLLCAASRVAQTLNNTANQKTYNWQEEDCKECQLPRYIEHQHKVADNKEWLAEGHLKGICNTELNCHNIRSNARDNISLALLGEVADIHIDNVIEHHITHTLQSRGTHTLNRISTKVAEEV